MYKIFSKVFDWNFWLHYKHVYMKNKCIAANNMMGIWKKYFKYGDMILYAVEMEYTTAWNDKFKI